MPLKCPACRKIYLEAKVDPDTDLEIDVCPECWGMWFDPNELAQFFSSPTLKNRFFLPEETRPLETIGYVISSRARACPRCRKAMEEKSFAGVLIDICIHCQGIWLDDGELQRIVVQYKKGARDGTQVSKELSDGLGGKIAGFSIKDVIHGFRAFLGFYSK